MVRADGWHSKANRHSVYSEESEVIGDTGSPKLDSWRLEKDQMTFVRSSAVLYRRTWVLGNWFSCVKKQGYMCSYKSGQWVYSSNFRNKVKQEIIPGFFVVCFLHFLVSCEKVIFYTFCKFCLVHYGSYNQYLNWKSSACKHKFLSKIHINIYHLSPRAAGTSLSVSEPSWNWCLIFFLQFFIEKSFN